MADGSLQQRNGDGTLNRAARIERFRNAIPFGLFLKFPEAMTHDQLEQIPKEIITNEQAKTEIKCTVCFCDFETNDEARKLPCNHIYHEKCIFPWLKENPSCPMCRYALVEDTGLDDIVRRKMNNTKNCCYFRFADPLLFFDCRTIPFVCRL